jgi:hypothetical protein
VIEKRKAWLTSSWLFLALALMGWAGVNLRARAAAAVQTNDATPFFNRKPYTADMTFTTGRNKNQVHHGKIYAGTQAVRMDMEIQPGMKSTMIIRYDKRVVWMLMPGQSRYMEMPINPRVGLLGALRDSDAKVEREDLGAEMVGDYNCEKYRIHSVSQGHEYDGVVWVGKGGPADGFLVKTQDAKSGATSEFSNIQPGEPPASDFQVPAGYEKFQMPGMPRE